MKHFYILFYFFFETLQASKSLIYYPPPTHFFSLHMKNNIFIYIRNSEIPISLGLAVSSHWRKNNNAITHSHKLTWQATCWNRHSSLRCLNCSWAQSLFFMREHYIHQRNLFSLHFQTYQYIPCSRFSSYIPNPWTNHAKGHLYSSHECVPQLKAEITHCLFIIYCWRAWCSSLSWQTSQKYYLKGSRTSPTKPLHCSFIVNIILNSVMISREVT